MDIVSVSEILRNNNRIVSEDLIRSNTRNAYIGQNRTICIVLGKYKMYVDTNDFGFSPHMIFEGFWEYWLTNFMAHNIQEGDVALDVGANLGYYSLLMSELVGGNGRVYCFEPNAAICSLLRATMGINGFASRSQIFDCALVDGDADGEIDFFVPDNEPKNGQIVASGFASGSGQTFKVKTKNINSLDLEKLDFVKIDVEGAELPVLKSLQDLKRRHSPKIVAEVNFGRGYGYDDIVGVLGYGDELLHIDFNSNVVPLTRAMADSERISEDWLVYWPGREPAVAL